MLPHCSIGNIVGILCFCVGALVLIMSVLTCPNFVNTVMNLSSIKRRKFLYQISNFQLQNESAAWCWFLC